jgi:hypothetical protein
MNVQRGDGPRLRSALLLSQAGVTLAVCSVIGFLSGYYLDRWLHSTPWFVLILGAMGVVAGFRELIRTLNRVNADEEARARAEKAARGMQDTGCATRDEEPARRDAGYEMHDKDAETGEGAGERRAVADDGHDASE